MSDRHDGGHGAGVTHPRLAAERGTMIGDASSPGTFVGRDADLERLALLLGVESDHPGSGAVLLGGDAGVGKTRLLAELGGRVSRAGWNVLVGHCLDFGDGAPPYLPFTEVFARVSAQWPALAASLIENEPALGRLMPGRPSSGEGEGEPVARMDRSDLFVAVHGGLRQLARVAPLLVVIEDVHWADHSTREMLSFLFARQFPDPVAIVASYRSDDLHRRHPLRAVAGEWGRLPGVARMQLQPLAEGDVRALVRSLHPGPLPEARLHGIVARAEGNAFFVEELVAAADQGRRSLPTDLADLLLVRVDQLDDSVGLVVRAASVAGRRVSHELLAQVAEVDDVILEHSLRAAVEANVLVAVGGDGYGFRHALLAEAVYGDLLPGERVRLHAAYVRVLSAHPAEGTAAELARHARAAHVTPIALRASIAAGDEAMALAGPAEAAQHYEHAIELLADPGAEADADPAVDPLALALRAADALIAAGNVFRAVALLEDHLRQLPADFPDRQRARLLHALAGAALQADTGTDPLQATTEAINLVPADPPDALRAQVVSMHARANGDRRRDDEAARWAAVALDLGRLLHLPDVVADATTTLARVDERAGAPEEWRRALEQAALDAAEAGEAAAELRALYALGGLNYTLGRLPEAAAVCRTAIERATHYGRPWAPYGLDARALAGIVAYVAGEWDEALRVVDVTQEEPPALAEALLASVGMAVAAGRGEASAIPLFADLRAWWQRDGQVAILSGGAAIDLYGDRGQVAQAKAVYDDVVVQVGELWQHPTFEARIRLGALMLAQLCAATATAGSADHAGLMRQGDGLVEAAVEAGEEHIRLRSQHGLENEAWMARVKAEQFRLQWLTDTGPPEMEKLVAAWWHSVEAFERFGHRFETSRSQARLAAVLQATGRPVEAARQARLAAETATRLGAAPLLEELRALGLEATVRRAGFERRDEDLTGREREVLVLLAAGRSNREIGHQLYISPKTVSVHVSNLMAKLGARSRSEAVAIARRRHLLAD